MMMKPLRVRYRIWIELDEPKKEDGESRGRRKKDTRGFIAGMGVARLLTAIKATRSLTIAAEQLGYSYKYAWDRTQKIKERLGELAVDAHKGGKGGGGEMILTDTGEKILQMYDDYNEFLSKCLEHKDAIMQSGILS
jgi:molybdate transport system regulatory protein